MIGLTARQQQCLDFMKRYRDERGVVPSFQEMSDHLGYNSKSRVYKLLETMENRGVIRRLKAKARAVEIVETADMQAVLLNREIFELVRAYAGSQRIGMDTAANELLREALGAA